MLRSRFEVFTAVSLALHVGVFAGAVLRGRHLPPAETGAAGGAPGVGAAAAVPGETFDVPELEDIPEESQAGTEAAPIELDGPSTPPPTENGESSAPHPAHRSSPHGRTARPAAEAAPSEPPPPLYGAVGERAAGDLVTTFKRVFPIAASSDPHWDHVPVGFYAEGDVSFFLADDGSLTHATASTAAAPAFRAAITRTATLLKHRLFTARGAVTHFCTWSSA